MTLEPESQTSAYLYYVTMFVKQDDRRRKVIPVIEKTPSPLQPKKRPHEELAVEGSDIEDVTDDVLFKKARADHIGFAKGESDRMTQWSLDHYRWRKLDEREKLEQSHKDFTKIRDDMETFCDKEEEKQVIKKQRRLVLASLLNKFSFPHHFLCSVMLRYLMLSMHGSF